MKNISLQVILYINEKTNGKKGYYFELLGPRHKKVMGPRCLRYATGFHCILRTPPV